MWDQVYFSSQAAQGATSTKQRCMKALTDEAKDVSDGGDEDHQEVVEGQYGSGDKEVSDPAELFSSETQRGDWRTDLKTHRI